MTIHPPEAHFLLAPSDIPDHLQRDHHEAIEQISRAADQPDQAHRIRIYLLQHGIESTGDSELDALVVFHEKAHRYSESRSTQQRRDEQAR